VVTQNSFSYSFFQNIKQLFPFSQLEKVYA